MSKTPKSDASYGKLQALRSSGYTGPVDQDGNKVTSGRAYEILQAVSSKSGTPSR